jgi:hypothetical protein
MLANNHRRVLRTDTDSSTIKKSKKQRDEKISHRPKLNSITRRQQTKSIKKERKKRMKKIPEQEIIITQSIEPKSNTRK